MTTREYFSQKNWFHHPRARRCYPKKWTKSGPFEGQDALDQIWLESAIVKKGHCFSASFASFTWGYSCFHPFRSSKKSQQNWIDSALRTDSTTISKHENRDISRMSFLWSFTHARKLSRWNLQNTSMRVSTKFGASSLFLLRGICPNSPVFTHFGNPNFVNLTWLKI